MRRIARHLVEGLRALAFRQRDDRELDEELRGYLDAAVEQKMRAGLGRDEALRAARAELGSVAAVKAAVRDAGWESWLEGLARDVRHALRTLRRAPGFTTVALVTLALGIGANTAVYSAIDAAFFRPLPFPDPHQIVRVRDVGVPVFSVDQAAIGARPVYVTDLFGARDTFARSAAYATGGLNLGSGPEPRRVAGTFVTTEFFQVFGREPQLGRTFTSAETSGDESGVTVLSHGLWQAHFGGDPAIVGRTVRLDGKPFEVVGVMPPDFRVPVQADLWVPLPVPVSLETMNAFRNYLPAFVVARLAPGVTPATAGARLDAIRRPYVDAHPDSVNAPTPALELVAPFQRFLAGSRQTVLALTVLMGSAGLVLLIACANVATLLLSRTATRRHEIATHAALGATRRRIIRRLLAESLLLALGGAALGLVVAAVSLPVLATLIPQDLVGLAPVRIDMRVLLFTAGAATAVGIVFGLWPALCAALAPPDRLLRPGAQGSTLHGRLNRGLVIAEVALACLLVIGAALMLSSLHRLLDNDLGMHPHLVATAQINFPSDWSGDGERHRAFVRSALDALRDAPGVQAAAAINTLPFTLSGTIMISFTADGSAPPADIEDWQRHASPYLLVSPGYFDTMGIPLLSGRDVSWSDGPAAPVAVVNRTMARRLWPATEPLGERFTYVGETPYTVVGVVEDARIADIGTDVGPQIYIPIQIFTSGYVSIVARGAGPDDVPALLARIRTAVQRVDPALPIHSAQSLETLTGSTVAPRRVNTLLVSAFGLLAFGLAAIGVYGLLAYSVAQRTREIGIRMAIGARTGDVRRAVMRQGLALVAAGLVFGIAAALATTRYLEGMLYGVTPRDPWTFAGVALLFVIAAVAASYGPARRATKVDPLAALRCE